MYVEVNEEQKKGKEKTEMVKGKLERRLEALVLKYVYIL
jgi:hypothetical protein